MTEEMLPLARRAVECKGWRWMPGMADQFGRRVMQVYPDELGFRWSHLLENNVVRDADALPDLTDPATVGCILELVRRAHANPDHLWGGRVEVHQDHRDIFVVVRPEHDPRGALFHRCIATGRTEVEALVNALHAE